MNMKLCPSCGLSLEGCLVFSSYPPHTYCGECGYIFDEDRKGEFIDV